MPDTLSQPLLNGTDPACRLSTQTMPAMASPIRIRYSTSAMPTWTSAVIRMPITAMISMTTPTAVAMPT